MFTSAECIQALQRRSRRSIRPQAPGTFPAGWQAWFDDMLAKPGRVKGATNAAIVGVLAVREPVFARGFERLSAPVALLRLWRYDVQADDRRHRVTRIAAMTLTFLFHVLWVVALMLLMYARFGGEPAEDEPLGEENVVQVEFIGEGTPDDASGGASPTQSEEIVAPSAAAPASQQAAAAFASPPLPEPAQATPTPEAQPVEVPVQQPLQVTETTEPDSTFVVPPLRTEGIRMPAVVTRTPIATRQAELRSLEAPVTPPTLRPLPQRELAVPVTRAPQVDAQVREVPMQPARAELRSIATQRVEAPVIRREVAATSRAIPTPSTAPAQASGTTPNATSSTATPSTAGRTTPASPAPGRGQGTRPDSTASGSGLAATRATGATPTPRRGDDWGDSDRNRAGGSSGLFNADGTPRLGNQGRVGGGLPPGTITEDYEKIDRMGTWLKRPPTDYEPTSLDRFWVPQETLLQEWVRRSIKEVLIPIPGTGKSLRCAVALLALGGACGIFDPNMLDVEAEARPPPDVPFKPDLHEDRESLGKPPGS